MSGTTSPCPALPVEEYQLDNGLVVLLSQNEPLPVVAVEVRYLVGSARERAGRTGFAHLFEHLMFEGSASYDAEYFRPFEPIGGVVNGTTNRDRTNYFQRVPRSHLELALWMESDRMQNLLPALTQHKLERQRAVVLNERRQNYENPPYAAASQRLSEALYPFAHPYRHLTIGYPQDIERATLDDVCDFFGEYYVPANAILTIAGDFERARTKALVNDYFASIPSGRRAATPTAWSPDDPCSFHETVTDDVKLPRIYLAWHTPALLAQGDAELDLFASVLAHGKSSRLYQPLVYQQRVAKDVSAHQVSQQLSSYFVVHATAAPGRSLEELQTALLAALERALGSPPSEDEISAAVNQYRKSFFSVLEAVVSRAGALSSYRHFAGTADYLASDLARYLTATPANVQALARRWLAPGRAVRVDVVPGPKVPPPKPNG